MDKHETKGDATETEQNWLKNTRWKTAWKTITNDAKNENKYRKDCYYQKKKHFEDLRCDFDNERNINEVERDLNMSYEVIQSLQKLIDVTIKMVNDLVTARSENKDNLNNLEI